MQKKSWLGVAPSQLISPHTNPSALVAVIIRILTMVTMLPVTNALAVSSHDKNPKKIGLVRFEQNLPQKSAPAYSGQR
jgi:hypothetical protein